MPHPFDLRREGWKNVKLQRVALFRAPRLPNNSYFPDVRADFPFLRLHHQISPKFVMDSTLDQIAAKCGTQLRAYRTSPLLREEVTDG